MNSSVLSQRYATPEMNSLFSEEGKTVMERELWISVLRAQRMLGMEVPDGVIEAYEAAKMDVDLGLIEEIERRTKHDVKAKIEAFVQAVGGREYLHMG